MSQEFSRFLGFAAATGALVLVVLVFGQRLIFSAAGPDAAIVTRLKQLERDGLDITTDGGQLIGSKLQYQRISVVIDADGRGASVTSTLDFTGLLRRDGVSDTKVSSLGLERARYRLTDDEWLPEKSDAPRLVDIVIALEQRRLAITAGAPAPDGGVVYGELRERVWRSQSWFIRSERDDVEVAEDYRLTGSTPERPVDEKATRRLSLREDSAQVFSFPGGIM